MKFGQGPAGRKGGRGDVGQTLREAVTAHQAGNFFKARKLYERVISDDESNIHGLHYLGILEAQQHNTTKALRLFDRALVIDPGSADVLADKGKVLAEAGDKVDALICFERAIGINPAHWMALQNQGATLLALKRPTEALSVFDRLIAIMGNHAPAFNNRGLALRDLNRFEEASSSFKQAVALNPQDAEAWTNLGDILFRMKNYDDATAAYDKAIAIDSGRAQAWLGRANVLCDFKQYEQAVSTYDKAIALKPNLAEAWLGRGSIMSDHKRYEEAIADFTKVLALKPDMVGTEGARLHAKMHICDWSSYDSECAHLISSVKAGKANVAPFPFLGISSSARDQLQCAKSWVAEKFPQKPNLVTRDNSDRAIIRIAYLSADFYEHPVSFLMAGLFERHDKSRFEVTAISIGPSDTSNMRRRLEAAFDHFVEAQSLSEKQLAELIESLEIDILIDMMGFTGIARTSVLARRVAPIQVSYLGYAGTMGADYFDYIIADRCVIPDDQREFYVEKVVYLPGSFMVNDSQRPISRDVPSRTECGLPDKGFVFCSFNQSYKITPDVFSVWMKLLNAVGDSVLWLSGVNETAVRNLRSEAQNQGISPDRLVFAKRVPRNEDHLARHKNADLFLDTLPFNAHSTASDALWAGLPVLTRVGDTFAGRVAASLLHAMGLPELIAKNWDEYEKIAIELATYPEKLASLKDKLSRNRLNAPLFDTGLSTRLIENAYVAMHERHQAGLPPDHIQVAG